MVWFLYIANSIVGPVNVCVALSWQHSKLENLVLKNTYQFFKPHIISSIVSPLALMALRMMLKYYTIETLLNTEILGNLKLSQHIPVNSSNQIVQFHPLFHSSPENNVEVLNY